MDDLEATEALLKAANKEVEKTREREAEEEAERARKARIQVRKDALNARIQAREEARQQAEWRTGMFRQIRTLWCLFCALGIACWVLLPWRIGWQGVSTCVWLTFSIAYSGFFVWFSPQLAKLRRNLSE